MRYVIDRLRKATDYSSMQPVERIGSDSVKRVACRVAHRAAANLKSPQWVQVRDTRTGGIVVTYDGLGRRI
jgi:hypothetical protein